MRQYHTKCSKFQRLSKAAPHRDDEIWDIANNIIKSSVLLEGDINPDAEDNNIKIQYSTV